MQKIKKYKGELIQPWDHSIDQLLDHNSNLQNSRELIINPEIWAKKQKLSRNQQSKILDTQKQSRLSRETKSMQYKRRHKFIKEDKFTIGDFQSFEFRNNTHKTMLKKQELIMLRNLASKDRSYFQTINSGSPLKTILFRPYQDIDNKSIVKKVNEFFRTHQNLPVRPASTCGYHKNENRFRKTMKKQIKSSNFYEKDSSDIAKQRLNIKNLQLANSSQTKQREKYVNNSSHLNKILRLKQDMRQKSITKYDKSLTTLKIETNIEATDSVFLNSNTILSVRQKNQKILKNLITKRGKSAFS